MIMQYLKKIVTFLYISIGCINISLYASFDLALYHLMEKKNYEAMQVLHRKKEWEQVSYNLPSPSWLNQQQSLPRSGYPQIPANRRQQTKQDDKKEYILRFELHKKYCDSNKTYSFELLWDTDMNFDDLMDQVTDKIKRNVEESHRANMCFQYESKTLTADANSYKEFIALFSKCAEQKGRIRIIIG